MAQTPKRSGPAKPAGRSPLTPFYIILAVVAVGGIGALLYQGMGKGKAATAPVQVAIDSAQLSRVQGIGMGREDAPVVIYEFADFQCPGCGQFAAFVAPLIKERLVQPGLVRYVYYDFPLAQHPHAFLAARAARCANEQGKFWEYHDVVYARQPRWSAEADATDTFVELGEEIGLDQGAFEGCVRSDKYAEEVTRSQMLGQQLGVQGTPTLFVNGERLAETPSFSQLEQLVRQKAGAAGAAPASPTAAPPAPAGDSAAAPAPAPAG